MVGQSYGPAGMNLAPGHENLPDTFDAYSLKTPIHNLPFYPQKDLHTTNNNDSTRGFGGADEKGFRWDQRNLEDMRGRWGKPLYMNKPQGWFPPRNLKKHTEYEGDIDNILMTMEQLRDMDEINFLGNWEDLWDDNTPGRQMEGIPQDYPHIMDYSDYLNTLPIDQLQGIEALMRHKMLNASRDRKLKKYWWAQSDV
tara:strand:+ start:501 stop:1091 length:591 start_codon:yes stop_codon:yes gene_type:complete